jgi:endoglucanase
MNSEKNKICIFIIIFFLGLSNSLLLASNNAFRQNQVLGKGMNISDLEAPKLGQWGIVIHKYYFKIIKNAGFNSVRIPIRWEAHAMSSAPYTINPKFFKTVDRVIKWAFDYKLAVVINIHHYPALQHNPASQKEEFLSLWKQISTHYKNYPDTLYFEILNEPNSNLNPKIWNVYWKEALKIIRQTNQDRTVIIDGPYWDSVWGIHLLKIPAQDKHIIVSLHYYSPMQFTHQGASWIKGSNAWLGTTWTGTAKEKQAIINDFNEVESWAQKNNRPIYLGEFGSYSKSPMKYRVLWTTFVRKQAEKRHWSWSYWEFCSGFGAWNPETKKWRRPLLKSLIGKAV